jgi:hypothetical protein
VVIAVFGVGIVVFFVASGTAAAAGGLVALLAVAFGVADQLPAGIGGGWVIGKGRRTRSQAVSQPDYIERAETPTEDAWRREQEHYAEKQRARDEE